MPTAGEPAFTFGDPAALDASLSDRVRGLVGSEILRIAAEIRDVVASGQAVCNLTVGDFDPRQFPVPAPLVGGIHDALAQGETNYPPADGLPALRRAVADYTARQWGVHYPVESVLIAGGARPVLHAAYQCVLNPGDRVIYPVPSWNNTHYAWLSAAIPVEIPTRAECGFQPGLTEIAPHLAGASLIVLNTPSNPSGTVMDAEDLRAITTALVEENARRSQGGRRAIFLVFDQIYGSLTFGERNHVHPVHLVPEAAPWVITVDGVSKAFAGTGLRVGWVLAAPVLISRIRDLLGHIGAWAPRPEQVAVAKFLNDPRAVATFRQTMDAAVRDRLHALYDGLMALRGAGYPVDCVSPQGAIYLSMRFDLVGRHLNGRRLDTNEEIRRVLLERAGVAVVPFQAFGARAETGWFRVSVGAVSVHDIEAALPRLKAVLDDVK